LQITPGGSKSWILRMMIGGRRRQAGLGSYPEVTLAMARERAREVRDAVWHGRDPIAEKRAAREALRTAVTFDEAAKRFLAVKAGEVSPREHKVMAAALANHASPVLGSMPVAAIEVQHVLQVLGPLWTEKTVTAAKLRGWIEATLNWATVNGLRAGDNPAQWRGRLQHVLAKPGKIAPKVHFAALQVSEAPGWMAELRQIDSIAARAVELLALTGVRLGNVCGMVWDEVDLDNAMWTIPSTKMKAAREHRVPLPPEALELLRSLPRMTGSPSVFTAPRGGELHARLLGDVMKALHKAKKGRDGVGYVDAATGQPAVCHGLRSTFRDWCAERGVDRDLAELSLAHTVGSEVERAYRRSDMLERRRALMASWADFLAGRESAKVVSLKTA
jgi:integrase